MSKNDYVTIRDFQVRCAEMIAIEHDGLTEVWVRESSSNRHLFTLPNTGHSLELLGAIVELEADAADTAQMLEAGRRTVLDTDAIRSAVVFLFSDEDAERGGDAVAALARVYGLRRSDPLTRSYEPLVGFRMVRHELEPRERSWEPRDSGFDRATESDRVQGFCPACAGQTLFLGRSGWLTCSRKGCWYPSSVSDLIAEEDHRHRLGIALRILEARALAARKGHTVGADRRDNPVGELATDAAQLVRVAAGCDVSSWSRRVEHIVEKHGPEFKTAEEVERGEATPIPGRIRLLEIAISMLIAEIERLEAEDEAGREVAYRREERGEERAPARSEEPWQLEDEAEARRALGRQLSTRLEALESEILWKC